MGRTWNVVKIVGSDNWNNSKKGLEDNPGGWKGIWVPPGGNPLSCSQVRSWNNSVGHIPGNPGIFSGPAKSFLGLGCCRSRCNQNAESFAPLR